MPKKKFYPPNDTGTQKRRFRCLLFQRPKAYPNRPRSNKKQSDQAYPPRLTDGGLDIPIHSIIKHITGGYP